MQTQSLSSFRSLLKVSLLLLYPFSAVAAVKPNVIVILVDDMGYGDIAAHGNPLIRTPHLDRLHSESARLTDFHVDPTCSPTRSALMTGKYSHRVKVWHTIAGGNHLRAGELTMAEVFRANGYRTGMFGKWHLGSNFPYRPIDRGFEEWLGQGDGGTGTTDDHFLNDRVDDFYIHNGERDQPIKGWAEDVFFNSALDFIRGSRKAEKPFFVYLATYSPHAPVTLPDPAAADDYKRKVDGGTACFFAAIERIDAQLGRLRAMLAGEGLERDTIVVFLTDNGGTAGVDVFKAGMRGQKGSSYDGGHRVPCFIHWPGGGLRKGEDIPSLSAHIDLLPTLVDLCGLKLAKQVDFDGRSLRSQLLDAGAEVPGRTLFVEVQRTFTAQKWQGAVAMTSRWRLVGNTQLYDIRQDPGQQRNVIAEHLDVAETLRGEFDSYWSRVTPGDRDRVAFIVGDERDPETLLSSSDWYLPDPPWNHAAVASGSAPVGDWRIRAAHAGQYRFEVRRWPREADAEIAGLPSFSKAVDAWDSKGPKPDLLYGNGRTNFRKLEVSSVRLTVGDKARILPVPNGARLVSFELELSPDVSYPVKAEFLDDSGEVIAGGCYVYCSKAGR